VCRFEIQPLLERVLSRTSFSPNCPSSSVRKLILSWLRHQTCFQLSTETRISLLFSDCDTLVLLTRVRRVECVGNPRKSLMILVFSVYWVFTLMMGEASNYPSHYILSKTEFQQQPSTSRYHNSQTVDPMRMG
jgi:hypothetical protein